MSEKNYTLYMHECPNGKLYFGITSQKVEARWSKGRGYINNDHFNRAINKYGWENIEHIVLAQNLTKEEACHYEEVLIAYFDTTNKDRGYNKSKGGETNSGWKMPDEVIERLRKRMKGNSYTKGIPLSEEHKRKISKANSASNNPNYGKKGKLHPAYGRVQSIEERAKRSKALLGHEVSKETRAKIGKASKGFKHTEETRRKMSETRKGHKHSEETKQKIKEGNKGKHKYSKAKKVHCIELNLIFNSMADANEYLGKDRRNGNIQKCCKGKQPTAWGYHWEYYEEQ